MYFISETADSLYIKLKFVNYTWNPDQAVSGTSWYQFLHYSWEIQQQQIATSKMIAEQDLDQTNYIWFLSFCDFKKLTEPNSLDAEHGVHEARNHSYTWRKKEPICFNSLLIKWWERTSYRFPNLKHLLCLSSVKLELEVSCFVGLVSESFSIAFTNLRKCLIYSG